MSNTSNGTLRFVLLPHFHQSGRMPLSFLAFPYLHIFFCLIRSVCLRFNQKWVLANNIECCILLLNHWQSTLATIEKTALNDNQGYLVLAKVGDQNHLCFISGFFYVDYLVLKAKLPSCWTLWRKFQLFLPTLITFKNYNCICKQQWICFLRIRAVS